MKLLKSGFSLSGFQIPTAHRRNLNTDSTVGFSGDGGFILAAMLLCSGQILCYVFCA